MAITLINNNFKQLYLE